MSSKLLQPGSPFARKYIVASPKCPSSNREQDLNHVQWQYPLCDDQRLHFIGKLVGLGLYPPYHFTSLLTKPNVRILAEFLKNNCKLNV